MRGVPLAAVCAFALACPRPVAAQDPLVRARVLYNAGLFEDAIAMAASAEVKPAAASSAALIAARARLELFRKVGSPAGLAEARSKLVSLNPRLLAPQELVEWQIGVGSALLLEDQAGPAADMFAAVLPSARMRLTRTEFAKFLEWWGAAMSQAAASLSGASRTRAFEKLRADSALELERDPFSRPATYWAVVASRGAGDLDAAWSAAVAGWIRAGGAQDGPQLRADLDAFVTHTLIPERAQARTGQRLDARAAVSEIAALNEEWRAITTRWTGKN